MTDTLNGLESRHPIVDIGAWSRNLDDPTRNALKAFAELMLGVTDLDADKSETATKFTVRSLGIRHMGQTEIELQSLEPVTKLTTALALAELIEEHGAEIGSGQYTNPPAWTTTTIGDKTYHHPSSLRAAFPAGTLLADAPVVAAIRTANSHIDDPQITVFAPHGHRGGARAVLDRITARGAELSPYRGRVVRAVQVSGYGLAFTIIDLPETLSRETVVVEESVWHEINLAVRAVTTQREMLNSHGLASRRSVLLAGPAGTGKSAVSVAVGREAVAAGFTVIYVEARCGANLLTSVVEEAQKFGTPVLLVLEDLDLYARERGTANSGGLSELLQAMDISPDGQIATLASTNDVTALDAAAIRTGRFDSLVEIGYPSREAAARILSTLVAGIPGGDAVDTTAVAARLPEKTSGSDVREIVRRAVLSGDGTVSTAALVAEIGSGRYRAQVPSGGQYL